MAPASKRGSRGPSYFTGRREVLAETTDERELINLAARPLGDRTNEVCNWFKARNWSVWHLNDECLIMEYTASFAGGYPRDERSFGSGLTTLNPLDCMLTLRAGQVVAEVTSCGIAHGCKKHELEYVQPANFDHEKFAAILDKWERDTDNVDRVELAECLTWGSCGSPESSS